MDDPTLVRVPFLSGGDGEAVQLAFDIGQLNTITYREIPRNRHGSILGAIGLPLESILPSMSKIRLSPSRVNDFSNCPQIYKFRVVDKLPESISLDAERGTLVHSVLEELFNSSADSRTYQRAKEILLLEWIGQLERKPDLAQLVLNEKEWIDRAAALLETYFSLEEPASIEPTSRELHLEMDLSADIYLHGYVDRLDIAPTGEVRIVDYKTGKAPKPGWEEKALFQLRIYALIYWRTFGVIPRLLQLMYLGDGQLIKNTPSEYELHNTEKKLLSIAADIRYAVENEIWIPKPSRLCDWCSFKSICPAFTD